MGSGGAGSEGMEGVKKWREWGSREGGGAGRKGKGRGGSGKVVEVTADCAAQLDTLINIIILLNKTFFHFCFVN